MDLPLATAFVAGWDGASTRGSELDRCDLDRALASATTLARAAFPELALDAVTFVSCLAARISADASVLDELAALRVDDLYLACACWHHDEHALAIFDGRILSAVPRFVARIDNSPDFADRLRQALREKLLLPVRAGKIGEYRGKGPLAAWVRVVAIRFALNERRGERRALLTDARQEANGVIEDPELDFLRSKYALEVRAALEHAVADLPSDARTILRMHYLDSLTIDQIAAVHEMHRSSVARRISEARRAILDETKLRLRDRLKVTATEIDSIVGLVKSQLELSLRRLLPPDDA